MLWINLLFAWCWLTLGLIAGALQGIGFHRASWMGGYGSWRRRLTRLGHIAFLGTGMLNLAFALSAGVWEMSYEQTVGPGVLLIVGATLVNTDLQSSSSGVAVHQGADMLF